MFQDLARIIITLGIILIIIGSVFWFLGKLPFFGKLPGDILIQKPNLTFYAPITTMIVVSVVLSIILTILTNLKK